MLRCNRCILPRNYTAVTFDKSGVCNLCREYKSHSENARREQERHRKELDRIVDEVQKDGGQYDCIVPISGGRDSSYAAYLMVRHFGLRVLGVNFDNGYRSPLAVDNLETVTRALGMDLVTLKPEPSLTQRIFAHFFKTKGYFCTACDAIGYIVIGSFLAREAHRTGRLILTIGGWSKKYEYQPGLSVLSMKMFGDVLQRDEKLYAALRGNPLVEPSIFDAFTSVDDIRQVLPKQSKKGSGRTAGAHVIQLPDYVDWDYREMGAVLNREMGWEEPQDSHGAHFDCRLAPLPEYLKHLKFGFSQEAIRNSVLIREGRMTRDEAIHRLELEQTTEPVVLNEVLAEWHMTSDDVAWDADWSCEKVLS